jgi:hypothetical protein
MWLAAWMVTSASADCGDRITVAPLVTPFDLPLPYGGSVRFDRTLDCEGPGGPSVALTFDVGAVPLWVHHTGYFLTLRQQLGVHIEPPSRHPRLGGAYVAMRTGVSELLFDDPIVALIPGFVAGFRWESRTRFTFQLGAGGEVWMPLAEGFEMSPWPVVELRFGTVLRPRSPPPGP